MSQGRISHEPPAALIAASVAASPSALRATRTTCRPSAARRSAMARPMPRLAPVTMATRLSMALSSDADLGVARFYGNAAVASDDGARRAAVEENQGWKKTRVFGKSCG
jgi:hypothetical protein